MITELGCIDLLRPRVTIGVLPDNVLLYIFDFYLDQVGHVDAWHTLVHVCRQWREVVFTSPRRLNLQLLCTTKRPVITTLDVWPALPIVIDSVATGIQPQGMGNIIDALKQHDRVSKINLRYIPNSLFRIFAAMKEPFPSLTELKISSGYGAVPIVPDSFLGGSTPQLRTLGLDGIPFPGLGKLLLSTSNLVDLDLRRIPHSGYISSQAIVAGLTASMRLKKLALGFQSPQSRDDQASWHPPPLTRIVLPTLTMLVFKGDSQYLEAIVSRIDAPLLDYLEITFFNQPTFDTPVLRDLISRTGAFTTFHRANVDFYPSSVNVTLFQRQGMLDSETLKLGISCKTSDRQLSAAAQLCNSTVPPFPTLEKLTINGDGVWLWQDDIGAPQWLEILQPFTRVKDLVLSEGLARLVAPALQELAGERVTETLPVLQNLFFDGPQPSGAVKEAMEKFIAARQLSGYPVTMSVVEGSGSGLMPGFQVGFDMNDIFGNTIGDFSFDADILSDWDLWFDPTPL